MDGLKELVEAFSTRIKSPIIGSVVLAFIAINWRPLFFLFFSGQPAEIKFSFFLQNTTALSLYVFPLLAGLTLALIAPWVNYVGARIIQSPVSKHRNLQLDAAHALAEKKTRHAIDMETVDAEYRRALLEGAKVEQEIKDADIDEDLREDLEQKFSEKSSPEIKLSAGTISKKRAEIVELSNYAIEFIKRIGKNDKGRMQVHEESGRYMVKFGTGPILPTHYVNRRIFLEAKETIHELEKPGYVEMFFDGKVAITKAGYDYLDSLEKPKAKS